jgi:hypothetical protein
VLRSAVAAAIKALEGAGVLTWVNRLVRIRKDGIVRVLRTSNGYQFLDPRGPKPSESDSPTETTSQVAPFVAAPQHTPLAASLQGWRGRLSASWTQPNE